jgi:hypothetical protein
MSAPFSMRYSVQIAEQTPHFRLKMPRRSIAISAISSIGHFRLGIYLPQTATTRGIAKHDTPCCEL